ncbi:MAG: hypothetical protein CL687_03940 [Candidatus Pelagibacter sp.]|nr:hypothetical protein [Candidatus Pelagibacter sp.]OUW23693.1 MAG: hypothetical protein CBD34_02565 [Rickettsiales bacterium TMED174]
MTKIIKWEIDKSFDEFPDEVKIFYQNNFIKLRKEYSQWIDLANNKFQDNIDWWSLFPSSRNPTYSSIYHFICIAETLKSVRKSKCVINLITNSQKASNFFFKNNFHKNKNITLNLLNKRYFNFNNFSHFLKSFIFQFFVFTFVKVFTKHKNINKNILINTYPSNKIEIPERLFQFSKNYQKKYSKNYAFIPTFIITKNIISLIKLILSLKNKNYYFKEHYLKFNDLIYAFSIIFRKKKFKINYKKFRKIDYSNLIFDEISDFKNFNTTIIGILNYRFAIRLKNKNLDIKKIISWYENHELKGWNLGFNRYFKHIVSLGYQGSTPLIPLMNSFPTLQEKKSNVVPNTFIVISKKYFKTLQEFNKNIDIKLGPALVYRRIFEKFKKSKRIKYLVILSEFKKINEQILKWIYFINKKKKNLKFLIKKPKITDMNEVIRLNEESNILFTDDYLPDLLKKTEFVITSGIGISTSAMEAMAYECKILVPIIYPYDDMYFKRLQIPQSFYKTFRRKNDLSNFFLKIDKQKSKNLKFKEFRKQYFSDSSEKIFFS